MLVMIMGLFDRVARFSVKCPRCGADLIDFQTKSFACLMRVITKDKFVEMAGDIDYWNGAAEMHALCDNCYKDGYRVWVSVTVEKENKEKPVSVSHDD